MGNSIPNNMKPPEPIGESKTMDTRLEKKINATLLQESKARLVKLGFLAELKDELLGEPIEQLPPNKWWVAIYTEVLETTQTSSGYLADGYILGVFPDLKEAKTSCNEHKDTFVTGKEKTLDWQIIDTDFLENGLEIVTDYAALYYDGQFIIRAVDKYS